MFAEHWSAIGENAGFINQGLARLKKLYRLAEGCQAEQLPLRGCNRPKAEAS